MGFIRLLKIAPAALVCLLPISCTQQKPLRNVIVLIPDGCGIGQMTIARYCKGAPLAQDSMNVSLVKTSDSRSMISGSAATATAYASGFKTLESKGKAQCLSLRPDSAPIPESKPLEPSQQWVPVATVLEGARLQGKATGLIATSRISNATPAAYASHWHSRNHEKCIVKQMVYQQIDVVFGGGYRYLLPKDSLIPGTSIKGKRNDGENLHKTLLNRGYKFITTHKELQNLSPKVEKIWGMFAADNMAHDIDRRVLAPDEPSLSLMTQKAIEILSKNPNGFFLMVEGSQIDWSSHDNDPVGTITDYLAFDQAVEIALDFASSPKGRGTLVIVVPDHDTGGMSLGRGDQSISNRLPANMINVINQSEVTAQGAGALILKKTNRFNPDPRIINRLIKRYLGIPHLNKKELSTILTEFSDTLLMGPGKIPKRDADGNLLADSTRINLGEILGPILSRKAGVGWTSDNHTGNDLPMFSHGLDPVPQTVDNTEIAGFCAAAMGFNLEDVNRKLVMEAPTLFKNASMEIDSNGVREGRGCLTVSRNGKTAKFPFFKNIAIVNGDSLEMAGLTLYSKKTHKVYLPEAAGLLP